MPDYPNMNEGEKNRKLRDNYIKEQKQKSAPPNIEGEDKETLESIFMALPKSCILKTPGLYNAKYECVYKERSKKHSLKAIGYTPSEAVTGLASLLALEQTNLHLNQLNKEKEKSSETNQQTKKRT